MSTKLTNNSNINLDNNLLIINELNLDKSILESVTKLMINFFYKINESEKIFCLLAFYTVSQYLDNRQLFNDDILDVIQTKYQAKFIFNGNIMNIYYKYIQLIIGALYRNDIDYFNFDCIEIISLRKKLIEYISQYSNTLPYIPNYLIPKLFINLMNINEILKLIYNLSFNLREKYNITKNVPMTLSSDDLIRLAKSVNFVVLSPDNSEILRELGSPKSFTYNLIAKLDSNIRSYLNDTLDINLITDYKINTLISKIISHYSMMT